MSGKISREQFLSGVAELPLVREVSCNNCGACCMHMGFPPFIAMYDYDAKHGDAEWLALPREVALECRQGAVESRGDQELPCLWLDPQTKQCRHYEQRPSVCRDFELGSPECLEHRARQGII